MALQPARDVERVPEAPEHLSDDVSELWDRIVGEYVLSTDALVVLEGALSSLNRSIECREIVDERGPVKVHPETGNRRIEPAARLELKYRRNALDALKQLGLSDVDVP